MQTDSQLTDFNRQEIVKKVKEQKQKYSQNKQLKLNWCQIVEKKLNVIVDMSYNKEIEIVCVVRNKPNIEFYKVKEGRLIFLQEIRLQRQRMISKIGWLDNCTVITSTLNGCIVQYGIESEKEKGSMQVSDCIWDMKVEGDMVMMGCDEGMLRIYRREKGESEMSLIRESRRQKGKCISVDWSEIDGKKTVYGMFNDNIVRKMEWTSLQVTLTIEPGQQYNLTQIKTIREHLIIGTNQGHILFYETQFGSRLKLIKEHIADILVISLSSDQLHIYVSGADSKILHITYAQNNYQLASQDRGQSHDVNSLLLLSPNLLISAGNSTDICLYPLDSNHAFPQRYFNTNNQKQLIHHRNIYDHMMIKTLQIKDNAFILVNLGFNMQLYKITSNNDYEFILEIKSKDSPIISHDINKNGNLIAYSTLEETTVLLLKNLNGNFHIEKATLDNSSKISASTVICFGKSSDLLYMINENKQMQSYDIITNSYTKIVDLNQFPVSFNQIQQTKNEKFIAIGAKNFTSDQILVIDTDTNIIIYQFQKYLKNRIFKTFKIDNDKLFVLYDNSKFIIIDFIKNKINKKTKQMLNKFPKNYLQQPNKVEDIILHPFNSQKIMLVALDYYVTVFLDHEIKESSLILQNKEEININSTSYLRTNFDIIKRKSPILFATSLNKSILLIQSEWKSLLSEIINPIYSKKFIK